ncbi:sulfatase-like hydrolase/transferase [Escherichia coli]
MLYLAYNAPHLPNDNPAPDQYQKQLNTGSQTADNYYASVYSLIRCKTHSRTTEEKRTDDNTIILFTSDNGAVIDGPLPLNGRKKAIRVRPILAVPHPNVYVVERKTSTR